MLMPKRVKYRKLQKGRMGGKATKGSSISFGDFGLQAAECGWITARQIEAARIAMTRLCQAWRQRYGSGCSHINHIRKKPAETRMGKGKGAPEGWVAVVKPGSVLYEMEGVTIEVAKEAFRLAATTSYRSPLNF